MRKIKTAVSPGRGNAKAVLRIILAITFGGTIATALIMAVLKFLEYCSIPTDTLAVMDKVLWGAGVPASLIIIAVYIFRTLRRRYAYSYMQNWLAELRENGYSRCPRCGSSVSEKTGTGNRRVHVADKITTTHYSDGSTSKSTQAVYENQSYKYTYHKCDDPACALNDDSCLKFGKMPYKVADMRTLILQEPSAKSRSAAYITSGGGQGAWKIVVVIAVILLIVGGLVFRGNMSSSYDQFGGAEVEGIDVSAPLGEEETKMMSDIRKIITDAEEYELRVSEVGGGLFSRDKDLEVDRFVDEKLGEGYTVEFDGIKSDSGLKGEYTLMPYNGEICLFHDKEETIYTPDSDFYKTHYESISKWTGKAVLTDVLDQIKTGELYENYTDMFVLRSDRISVFIAQDGSVRLLDENGEKVIRYIFTPQDTAKPVNYADYKPAGYEDEETDELQKLLNKADYNADVEWYVNGECVGEIEVNDNGDGSYTFSNSYNPTDKAAMGKYILYPEEKRYEYFKYENPELYTLSETAEAYTETDSPDTYKWLWDIIPENYVRAHLNLDNAKKSSLLGLATTYTEEFGDGKKSVLEVDVTGSVSFEYHESEDSYVEINW